MADPLLPDNLDLEDPNTRWTLQNVADALRGLRFGVVTLVVQDGVVVQLERTERRRYQRNESSPPRSGG